MTGLVLLSLIVVFFGHWLADFVWQPDWMGKGKSSSWSILGEHAWRIYLGSYFTAFAVALLLHGNYGWVVFWEIFAFALVNGASHFVIDAVTSRMTGRYWRLEKVHEFFVTIGFDQFLHMTIAVVTLWWLLV